MECRNLFLLKTELEKLSENILKIFCEIYITTSQKDVPYCFLSYSTNFQKYILCTKKVIIHENIDYNLVTWSESSMVSSRKCRFQDSSK